ncbi:MAG: porin [Planctomycetaceae bacterium]|nr:porin [Planctomycetaceae bacterium]MBX3581375.1 porin [Rhizobiaceae bacterium]
MNIKGLLLGSAAALVAVSGARAADAVVIAEPEPFEYVRICDTYGAGFYYIPGTETCLKFSGYMRYDVGVGDYFSAATDVLDKGSPPGTPDFGDENDTYYKNARLALRIDARQETELGTLRAYAQINFNSGSVNSHYVAFPGTDMTDIAETVDIEHAYLELGGFRVGVTDSLFSTFTGYAGAVINDDGIGYGPFSTNQMAYTFTGGNGFTAAVALEMGDGNGVSDPTAWPNIYTVDSYMPHVVGGVGWTGGWGGVSGVVGYDSNWEVWAAKARVDFNVNDAFSLFLMGGYADKDDYAFFGGYQPNYYGNWSGDWAVWGGGSFAFNEQAKLNVQLSYDDWENFVAVANVEYELVNNFTITPEVIYYDNFDSAIEDADAWGGYLRFQYNWGS